MLKNFKRQPDEMTSDAEELTKKSIQLSENSKRRSVNMSFKSNEVIETNNDTPVFDDSFLPNKYPPVSCPTSPEALQERPSPVKPQVKFQFLLT